VHEQDNEVIICLSKSKLKDAMRNLSISTQKERRKSKANSKSEKTKANLQKMELEYLEMQKEDYFSASSELCRSSTEEATQLTMSDVSSRENSSTFIHKYSETDSPTIECYVESQVEASSHESAVIDKIIQNTQINPQSLRLCTGNKLNKLFNVLVNKKLYFAPRFEKRRSKNSTPNIYRKMQISAEKDHIYCWEKSKNLIAQRYYFVEDGIPFFDKKALGLCLFNFCCYSKLGRKDQCKGVVKESIVDLRNFNEINELLIDDDNMKKYTNLLKVKADLLDC